MYIEFSDVYSRVIKLISKLVNIFVALELHIHVSTPLIKYFRTIALLGVKSLRTKTISNKDHFVQGRPLRTKA